MLFKKAEQLREFSGVGEIKMVAVAKYVKNAEEDYLVPVLGPELYNDLNTAYTEAADENTLPGVTKSLLERCRRLVAPYFVYEWAPRAELLLSDSGLQRQETATSKSAYQYQANNFRESALREGERETEKLYAFLEKHTTAYPAWATSTAFTAYRSLFFHTATDFASVFPSASPYRVFYAVRSRMQDIEEACIRPALGDALFDYLKAVDRSPTATFSLREGALMLRIKKALAYQTIAAAVPFLNVRVGPEGLTVASTAPFTSNDKENSRSGATDSAISNLVSTCNSSGQLWMKSIAKYLVDYQADFAEWLPVVAQPVVPEQRPGNESYRASFGLT